MSAKTGTRGPYAKTAKVRARAIDAGIALFSSAGYNGATLTVIAETLGMTLTGLQHHFPTKESLLTAVLEERDRRAEEALPSSGSHTDAFENLAAMLSESQKTPGLMELQCVLSAEATSADHPAHEYFQRRYARLRGEATEAFRQMAEDGQLTSAYEPASLAAMLIAVVDGLQLQWLLERGSVDIEAETRRFLRTFIPAIH
ncbi:AcrR family transcriptional regulator [Actinoplanes lutulentus]|uniref:TetR family transcriptional regulator n=1 Tax=Actinoplanes lutulentus TaxID=1287878 RepID=A0A327ZCZ6_9ACTN|nr:TetR/AcrR family transcriptional regulator [Actinoplanes lutulentus]MBB2947331.1 AcrR family transcriptional regulator [Actinoplanes lutulentus]RAK36606.1 TetR family transcriptional regulator [Actinoplanes lutulentus]